MGILRAKKSVSLELRDDKLRAVELAKKGKNIHIQNYGEKSLPEGLISGGKLYDSPGLAKELNKFWSENNFGSKDVVIGISNQDVIVRFTSFPKVDEKKLDNIVKFQSQDIFPLDIKSLIFDYAVIGEKSEENKSFWEVLLIAGKEQMIYDFLHCLDEAGLRIQEIEVLSLSLMRLSNEEQLHQVVLVMDVGGGISNLLITNYGTPRLARMVSPPGAEEMEETDETSFSETTVSEESEKSNKSHTYNVDNQLNYIINCVGTSIDYYQSQNPENPVEKIVLCGIDEGNDQLVTRLEEELGIPVELNDPLNALNISSNGMMKDSASKFSQSISLAFKGLEEN